MRIHRCFLLAHWKCDSLLIYIVFIEKLVVNHIVVPLCVMSYFSLLVSRFSFHCWLLVIWLYCGWVVFCVFFWCSFCLEPISFLHLWVNFFSLNLRLPLHLQIFYFIPFAVIIPFPLNTPYHVVQSFKFCPFHPQKLPKLRHSETLCVTWQNQLQCCTNISNFPFPLWL